MSSGIIALAGGNEFRDNCKAMDRRLLDSIGSRPEAVAVAVLPTAAIKGSPRMAADNGVRYFNSLGAKAYPVMVVTREDAENPAYAKDIEQADMVYLAGGDPWYLLEVIRDSAILTAARRVYERGGILAGSSAGAMVLAAQMRTEDFGSWLDALDITPGVAVLPHHEHANGHQVDPLRGRLNKDITLLGIDEATACFSRNASHAWEVAGIGGVTVYRPDGAIRYTAGKLFTLSDVQ